jgi:hypothetical protein
MLADSGAQTLTQRIAVNRVILSVVVFHARQLQAFDAGDFDAKQFAIL